MSLYGIINWLLSSLLTYTHQHPHPHTHTHTARELDIANKNLEEEKQKVVQLKRDMDGFKKKTKAEQQTAARLVS